MPFTKYGLTTATSTSCAGKHRRRTDLGTWNRSGNCRARADVGSCSSSVSDNSSLWLTEGAPSIFVRQHERHHRLAVIARSRDRFQRHQAHPLWPTPGGRVDSLVWPQGRISNDAVEVEQQVARVNSSGRDCPLDGGMKHPDHVPEAALQTLVWWQVCLLLYWPYVAMECGGGHRKRPLHELATHLTHRCLPAID